MSCTLHDPRDLRFVKLRIPVKAIRSEYLSAPRPKTSGHDNVSASLLHAKRHGDSWHSRIPVVWLENLKTQAWEAQVFQICVIVVFVAVPVAGIIRCMGEAESGDICEYKTSHRYIGSATTLAWPPVAKEGRQMRLRRSGAGNAECTDGIEVFPRSLTPLGFYLVPLAAMGLALAALGFVAFRPNTPTLTDTD